MGTGTITSLNNKGEVPDHCWGELFLLIWSSQNGMILIYFVGIYSLARIPLHSLFCRLHGGWRTYVCATSHNLYKNLCK